MWGRPRVSRRTGLVAATCAVLAVGGAGVVVLRASDDGSTGRPAARPPNILVIMTDDQTVESMRVMTSVDDLIAAHGVSFESSVASFPLCCPSRATFLTGQYMHNHGVRGNLPPHGGFRAFEHQDTTFPVALERAGYDTIHIGKYLNGYGAEPPVEVPPGWSEWHGAIEPTTHSYVGFTLLEDGEPQTYGEEHYQTDVYTELAERAIRSRADGDRPFFLNVAYLAPHVDAEEGSEAEGDTRSTARPAPRHAAAFEGEPLPATAATGEEDLSDKPAVVQGQPEITDAVRAEMADAYARALESLLAVDEGVEQIMRALEETGQLEDTVVIFTSDNGFLRGEHGIAAGKSWFYEPSIRVPLLMRGPGIPAGATRRALVANIDLAPTVLDLAGAEPVRTMDGRSLVPLLREESENEDRAILLESGGPFSPNVGLRTTRYAYWELATGERELYDLTADPDQLQNLSGQAATAEIEADLAARLAPLPGCEGSGCR